jgi:hypothetical protein
VAALFSRCENPQPLRLAEIALVFVRFDSSGWVSALDVEGRTIWIVDAHDYEKRFILRADEMLTAFVELEAAIRACGELS